MNKGSSIFLGIMVIFIGVIWTVGAVSLTSRAPNEMGFVKILFPAFGVVFISMGIYNLVKGVAINKKTKNNTYYTDSADEELDQKEYKVYREGEEEKSLRCPMCHSTVKETQKFCINCGNKLKE